MKVKLNLMLALSHRAEVLILDEPTSGTAYQLGKPFITYIVVAFLVIGTGEALHHIPGLEALNAFGFDHIALQLSLLTAGAVLLYTAMTWFSHQRACADFEKIDL